MAKKTEVERDLKKLLHVARNAVEAFDDLENGLTRRSLSRMDLAITRLWRVVDLLEPWPSR